MHQLGYNAQIQDASVGVQFEITIYRMGNGSYAIAVEATNHGYNYGSAGNRPGNASRVYSFPFPSAETMGEPVVDNSNVGRNSRREMEV